MRLVGLTGGIGSGKSSVSRILAAYGASIIDADHITHNLQQRGRPLWSAILKAFGWPILLADGSLDRKKLGRLVFNDADQRHVLNHIVRPAVQREIHAGIERARGEGAALVVIDVPLLIEGGLYRIVDEVWVVYTEPEQQAARIQQRDGVSADTAWRRIAAQMPLKDKLAYAQRVIDNRGTERELEEVVRNLWQSAMSNT